MPRYRCPIGCANPSTDWHDWERCPDCHPPFHFWRWNTLNREASEQRLGERIYISACLLWTAIHDRHLAHRLLHQSPNWSAVCHYYSIVHCLRLFWFLLYGSYPKGHAELAKGLQSGTRGATGNWSNDQLRPGEGSVSSASFQTLLRYRLNSQTLSDHVPLVGTMFEQARVLRNDSNYESLILAHQYFHRSTEVNITDEMARTAAVMADSSQCAIQFTSQVMSLVFRDDRLWIGADSPYSGADLKALLLCYVYDKIRGANNGQEPNDDILTEWLQGVPYILQDMTVAVASGDNNSARDLVSRVDYSVFSTKRTLMREFQSKVTQLELALHRAV